MGQKGNQPTLASIGQEKYSIFLPKCFAKGHANIEPQRTWYYSVTTTDYASMLMREEKLDALEPPDDGPNCLVLPIVSILHRRRWTILVTACLMTIPALSISFLESPEVTQTFSAG